MLRSNLTPHYEPRRPTSRVRAAPKLATEARNRSPRRDCAAVRMSDRGMKRAG